MASKSSTNSNSASPASTSAPSSKSEAAPTSTSTTSASKAKAHNVFSNDGSFMDRFKSMKQGAASEKQDGKLKQNQALQRRKAQEERIRNRGKRLQSPSAEASGSEEEGVEGSKKRRKQTDSEETETDVYLREVRKLERSTLKDSGSGVRSLVK